MIERIRSIRIFRWLVVALRIILGLSFIYPSLPKILGHRFTTLGIDNPVGYFFECMYNTGFYYNFLGYAQLLAGILLVTQRWALLGTLIFVPIIINIYVITISVGFRGTTYITFMMMLAGFVLLVWDYKKLRPILDRGQNNE